MKISKARADNVLLRSTLEGLVAAVKGQPTAKTSAVRKEIVYAELILKETADDES